MFQFLFLSAATANTDPGQYPITASFKLFISLIDCFHCHYRDTGIAVAAATLFADGINIWTATVAVNWAAPPGGHENLTQGNWKLLLMQDIWEAVISD